MAGIAERYRVPDGHFWLHGPRSGPPVEVDADTGMWNVYGYPELHQVLGDPATFSSDIIRVLPDDQKPDDADFSLAGLLTQIDPPQHGTMRKLVSSAFTRRVVADLEPKIAGLTRELLDAARERGHLELVADLAYPLPVVVVAELLGVPSSDRPLFKRWADALFQRDADVSPDEPAAEQDLDPQISLKQWREMSAYLAGHAAERRRRPRADLLTRLVEAEVDGEHLPDQQVANFGILLLLAGHITTTMLLGNAVLCLDAFPEQQDRVRADRSAIPAVIEESLRFLSPSAALARTTTREVELGGVSIPADRMGLIWAGAANRDPRRFADPDVFDPARDPNPHVAFGRGIHFCLGAPLARLEGRIALDILLDRCDPLRTDPDDPVEFMPTPMVTGVLRLPLH